MSVQSADAKAASDSGSAGGTTVSIQVYRSSFPIVKWDLNDDDFSLTKAAWAEKPADSALPQRGTPGQAIEWPEVGMPSGYAEPTRAGFEFAGWSTDKSASAGGRIDGTEPKLSMPDGAPAGGEYTLYALWTPNEYSVVFDLAKNPEVGDGPGSDASFALNWDSKDGVRTVTDLGSGRYRVDGFTMSEAHYDPVTRTVGLPEPSRTGYRFLGWAEPSGQSLAIDNAAKDGFAMNPVRLTQIDGTPVLTARWASAFGVTAPLSITFGDYDKTGAPGNPSLGEPSSSAADDTTQSEADDVETAGLSDQQRYKAAGAAYFENTGWADAVRMVAVTSERDADANQVLTTYDSSKASEAAVLGDGTAANPGERLLSLYPASSAPADKSTGIHFRLSDSLAEGDLAAMPSIAAGAQQPVTYGLNLSTDPVTGSPNHGLVLETQDYEPKQIATVSYTFATADAASEEPAKAFVPAPSKPTGPDGDFYLYLTESQAMSVSTSETTIQPGYYGAKTIKIAATDLADSGASSIYYEAFKKIMDQDIKFKAKWKNVSSDNANAALDTTYEYDIRIIGLLQDYANESRTAFAGITFQFADNGLTYSYRQNNVDNNSTGWENSELRGRMNAPGWEDSSVMTYGDAEAKGSIWARAPKVIQDNVQPVYKLTHNAAGNTMTAVSPTRDQLFLASYAEMVASTSTYYTDSTWVASYNNNWLKDEGVKGTVYQYWKAKNISGKTSNDFMVKKAQASAAPTDTGWSAGNWWERSTRPARTDRILHVYRAGDPYHSYEPTTNFTVVPCFCF